MRQVWKTEARGASEAEAGRSGQLNDEWSWMS